MEMQMQIGGLTIVSGRQPIGTEAVSPRFSWRLQDSRPDQRQSAYRIVVAADREELNADGGSVWDSGKVESDRSVLVEYGGAQLEQDRTYYWKVMVWDREGSASAWSDAASWSTGLWHADAWTGQWIGREVAEDEAYPAPSYVRREFAVSKPVRRAVLYATALGAYELRLNGRRVSDDLFAPGFTDYNIRTQYQIYDVAGLLNGGDNAVGAIVGTGWYAGHVGMMGKHRYGVSPQFLSQLHIEYTDGSSERIVTDGSWSIGTGGIVYSDMLKGESYDARLEPSGWDAPGFAAAGWSSPHVFEAYAGKLVAQIDPPVKVLQTLKPVEVKRTERGTYVFDLGQNIAGWVKLKLEGAAGTQVFVRHAEMLNPDGTLYTANLRRAEAIDRYTLAGAGVEEFEPHFTFHGFRYAELEGYEGDVDAETLVGRAVYSDTPAAGTFETNDDKINRLFSNIAWGQRGNFLSIPTDCPQRDERLGWTGDAQIFIRTAAYNMDVSDFFRKFMYDMADAQSPGGAFPDVAPDAGWVAFKLAEERRLKWYAPDNAGWGDAGVIIPWTIYLMYGDTAILEEHYTRMQRWVDYLGRHSARGVRPAYADYGDWLSIGEDTPKDVLATAYYAYSTELFVRIARVLGRDEDAAEYEARWQSIREAFVRAFVGEDGVIDGDTQTVYVLALYFRLLPESLIGKAAARLRDKIRANGNRLSTGFLGVGYLLPALSEQGMDDLAYELLHQEEFPSWLYSVNHGATTIWERWDGWTAHAGFQTPGMNSFNHYSLGSVGEWMYRYAAGIEADPAAPGFKHIVLRPRPGGKLDRVQASYESPYGTIGSSWRIEGDEFVLEADIPVNTTATVHLPGDGAAVTSAGGVTALEPEGAAGRVYRAGSGKHVFRCTLAAGRAAKV